MGISNSMEKLNGGIYIYKAMQRNNTQEINIRCVQDKLNHNILNEVSIAIHVRLGSQEALSQILVYSCRNNLEIYILTMEIIRTWNNHVTQYN